MTSPAVRSCGCLLCFVCGARYQKGNHFGSVVGRCEPAKRLHIIPWHNLLGVGYEAIQLRLIPGETRALHRTRVGVVLKRTCFSADNVVQAGTEPVVPFSGRVTGATGIVEYQLP